MEITKSLNMMDIKMLVVQQEVEWDKDEKFLILRLVMFGAFYPNYFVRGDNSELEKQANRMLNTRDPRTCVYMTGFPQHQSEYGILYENQFKGLFVDTMYAGDVDKIRVEVEGQKVMVQFQRPVQDYGRDIRTYEQSKKQEQNRNYTGDVVHQVYVAVKMRGSREKKEVFFICIDNYRLWHAGIKSIYQGPSH